MWESEGEAWSGDESVSSTASHKGDMCNDALHVIGLHGFGGKISLFLQNWELAKVAPNCHMALDVRCQEMHEACCGAADTERPFVTATEAFLCPSTGCDKKERDVREDKGRRNVSDEPF